MAFEVSNQDYSHVKRLVEGDEKAFAALYNKYCRKIYTAAFNMTLSEDDAKDIIQDVFLKVWESRATIDPEQNFVAYLNTVCWHICLNMIKKETHRETLKNKWQQVAEMSEDPDRDDEDFHEKYLQLLEKAIAALPPQRRVIFEHCKLKEKTYDEVAHSMNITRGTVHDHIKKANKFIREYLTKNGNFTYAILFSILNQLMH
jgi:RNA polymerase sigma-70 factor (ECF subfamily)